VRDELDLAVEAHLARMPEPMPALLRPAIDPRTEDGWLREALLAYLRHFVRLFEHDEPRESAETRLADELASVAGTTRSGDDDADITAAEAALAGRFGVRGLQFQGGRTPPHLGAYVWRRTEVRQFTVTLPRGEPQPVTVHFMHDFLIRGWLHWRTFGTQGAGGWYKQDEPGWEDGLYAVADRYPEPLDENRSFQVSLLGHEAQHVADHRAFPGLSSTELEYRAKLVELIGYDTAAERLDFFVADAADDPEQPHPYAAHLILKRLGERLPRAADDGWDAVPYDEIRRQATALLDEDTARLAAREG
jgi:hypothetical protein